ncbi:MAG: hypothetical protein V1744_01625 [Candidatus Altiarchaeota archaeon]
MKVRKEGSAGWLPMVMASLIILTFLCSHACAEESDGLVSNVLEILVGWLADAIVNVIGALATVLVFTLTNETLSNPKINEGSYLQMAGLIMEVIIPILLFFILYSSIKLIFASISPGERSQAKSQLHSLIVALVIIPVSPHLYQILLDVSFAMTKSLLMGDGTNPSTYQEVVGDSNFGHLIGSTFVAGLASGNLSGMCCIFIVAQIVSLLALVMLFLRYIIVVFLAVLLPLTCLLYLFDFTKTIGRQFLKYTIAWALVTPIAAFWIIVAAVTLTGASFFHPLDYMLSMFMTIVFLFMVIMSPLQITGTLEVVGGAMTAIGQMLPGPWAVAVVAVGQMLKTQSAEGLVAAGFKVGATKMKGLADKKAAGGAKKPGKSGSGDTGGKGGGGKDRKGGVGAGFDAAKGGPLSQDLAKQMGQWGSMNAAQRTGLVVGGLAGLGAAGLKGVGKMMGGAGKSALGLALNPLGLLKQPIDAVKGGLNYGRRMGADIGKFKSTLKNPSTPASKPPAPPKDAGAEVKDMQKKEGGKGDGKGGDGKGGDEDKDKKKEKEKEYSDFKQSLMGGGGKKRRETAGGQLEKMMGEE